MFIDEVLRGVKISREAALAGLYELEQFGSLCHCGSGASVNDWLICKLAPIISAGMEDPAKELKDAFERAKSGAGYPRAHTLNRGGSHV